MTSSSLKSLKTRRAFLEATGLAAGALALPGAARAQATGSAPVAELMAEGALSPEEMDKQLESLLKG